MKIIEWKLWEKYPTYLKKKSLANNCWQASSAALLPNVRPIKMKENYRRHCCCCCQWRRCHRSCYVRNANAQCSTFFLLVLLTSLSFFITFYFHLYVCRPAIYGSMRRTVDFNFDYQNISRKHGERENERKRVHECFNWIFSRAARKKAKWAWNNHLVHGSCVSVCLRTLAKITA